MCKKIKFIIIISIEVCVVSDLMMNAGWRSLHQMQNNLHEDINSKKSSIWYVQSACRFIFPPGASQPSATDHFSLQLIQISPIGLLRCVRIQCVITATCCCCVSSFCGHPDVNSIFFSAPTHAARPPPTFQHS